MALLGAARDAKVRRLIYAASSSAYGDVPNCRRVKTWHPIRLSPWKPPAKPVAMQTESGDLLIQVPHAASNNMATVVILVVSKGGNPAAGPNRKKHWTGWFGRHLPASLLLPVF